MARYPVCIAVKPYNGRNPKLQLEYQRRIEAANKIEAYLNEQMKGKGTTIFTYFEIAEATSLSKQIVEKILFRYDGGSNGITIFKDEAPKKDTA